MSDRKRLTPTQKTALDELKRTGIATSGQLAVACGLGHTPRLRMLFWKDDLAPLVQSGRVVRVAETDTYRLPDAGVRK